MKASSRSESICPTIRPVETLLKIKNQDSPAMQRVRDERF